MAKIRVRKETGTLYFDFAFRGQRCREQTTLSDSSSNRKRLEVVLKRLEKEISAGTFVYSEYFPKSKRVLTFESPNIVELPTPTELVAMAIEANQPMSAPGTKLVSPNLATPLFSDFADLWYSEREVDWKRSTQTKVRDVINGHLIPRFKGRRIGDITKADILSFRSYLAKEHNEGKGLSTARVNQILNTLSQIVGEAADRYEFTTPYRGIKPLRVPRTEVDPFSLQEVQQYLDEVVVKYRPYYTVAFFTGMRTSELIGLKWRYVDFERREIHIRETVVYGHEDTPKTDGSDRTILMSSMVAEALAIQFEETGALGGFVFCDQDGGHLHYRNLSNRIWHPTLKKLGLRRRKPYQTRHTAATLWLAAGESPEWIARQMGHTTTKMLFSVYSRYVPNLTRQDGSAMDRLLKQHIDLGREGLHG